MGDRDSSIKIESEDELHNFEICGVCKTTEFFRQVISHEKS